MSGFFDAIEQAERKPRKRIAAEQQIAQETLLLGRAAAGSDDPATLAAEMREFAAAGKFRPPWEYSRLLLQGAVMLERMVKLASD